MRTVAVALPFARLTPAASMTRAAAAASCACAMAGVANRASASAAVRTDCIMICSGGFCMLFWTGYTRTSGKVRCAAKMLVHALKRPLAGDARRPGAQCRGRADLLDFDARTLGSRLVDPAVALCFRELFCIEHDALAVQTLPHVHGEVRAFPVERRVQAHGCDDVRIVAGERAVTVVEPADVVPAALEREPDDGRTGMQNDRAVDLDGARQWCMLQQCDVASGLDRDALLLERIGAAWRSVIHELHAAHGVSRSRS